MPHPEITMTQEGIHNPAEPRHYMRLKPVKGRVRVLREGAVLADSSRALRLLEVGKDLYDPVFYFPEEDVKAQLLPNDAKTHCPLKGDAAYFDLVGAEGRIAEQKIAWTYGEPFGFAEGLAGLIAFYADKVVFEEYPAGYDG